jgi:hypothetical protein
MNASAFTPDQVAAIVREVLRRIRADLQPAVAAAPAAPAALALPAAQAAAAPTAAAGVFQLAEKLITAASLAAIPAGTKTVMLRHDALITPSGRDAARAAGCTLLRPAKGAQATPGAAPASRPFFVAAAECPGDSAARTAGLVRLLPGAQQLPATGLTDVVASLGLHLTRDGGRGILLAGRPHVAVALANRSPGVRAVTARDTTTLLGAAQECAANLLVIAPRDFSASSLERIGVTLAGRDPGPAPAELAPPAAAGCACSGPKADAPACSCTTHHH